MGLLLSTGTPSLISDFTAQLLIPTHCARFVLTPHGTQQAARVLPFSDSVHRQKRAVAAGQLLTARARLGKPAHKRHTGACVLSCTVLWDLY